MDTGLYGSGLLQVLTLIGDWTAVAERRVQPLTIVESLDVIKHAPRAAAWLSNTLTGNSVLSVAKKLSIAALEEQLPWRLILLTIFACARSA